MANACLSFPLVVMEEPFDPCAVAALPPLTRPRPWVRESLLICLGLKALLMFLGVVVAEVRLDKPFRTTEEILKIWHQWDSRHYFDIAENGYKPPGEGTTLVLPPLLPMLIRAASWVTGSLMSGGVPGHAIVPAGPADVPPARCDLDEENAFRACWCCCSFRPASSSTSSTEGLFPPSWRVPRGEARELMAVAARRPGGLTCTTPSSCSALSSGARVLQGRVWRVLAALSVGLGIAVYL
jgi:hypothetical protein